ncbi:MAG: hypothetical protein ACJ8FY_07940 [Gemmataceae bacterium]
MKNIGLGPKMLAMLSFFFSGCGQAPNLSKQPPDTDVSALPEYNFSGFAGTVWKTKVKTGLADIKRSNGRHETYLLAPEDFDPAHPRYRPPPYMQLITVLPAGTYLRIERLMKSSGNWSGVFVTASLETSALEYGKEEVRKEVNLSNYLLVKNRFIRDGSPECRDWGVDPDQLEK